jgi:methionyl-tRNA formyltransferase
MECFIILSEKAWHDSLFTFCVENFKKYQWEWIKSKQDFSIESIKELKPKKIFIPHWSYKIPKEIHAAYECVVFHMTDLPYGRGGSPLQNLIVRGHKETKMSAIRAVEEFDAGDIYLKKSLNLSGTAKEIFERSNDLMKSMIKEIIDKNLIPTPQQGTPTIFKRRRPTMSSIQALGDLDKIYDYIRMLDADGYPNAFLETDKVKFEFTNAKLVKDKLQADVRITKK